MNGKIISIQRPPEDWRENYHYGLYTHKLMTKDGIAYSRPFIVIRNNFGVIARFTNLHNYACIYENKVFVPITSDSEARLHYICMMLNYVLIKHYDRFRMTMILKSIIKLTMMMIMVKMRKILKKSPTIILLLTHCLKLLKKSQPKTM